MSNLNQLFGQDMLKLEIGKKTKRSFINLKNGHAHKFEVEKSPSARLIIRIDDNEKMIELSQEYLKGILIYSPKMNQWTAQIDSNKEQKRSREKNLKNIIETTLVNSNWVSSQNLTRQQIQNLPKRSTKKSLERGKNL